MIEAKGYTLQEAYQKTGGMGLFHFFACTLLIMGFMSGSFLGQQMQFVELVPKYLCSTEATITKDNQFKCAPYEKTEENVLIPGFCDNTTIKNYMVNYDDPLSLHNWIEDLKDPDLTWILGSMQFVGWAISACITPRLADLYGRRPIFLFSMLLQLAALMGIYFSKSVKLTTGLIFFFGMGGVGRSSISYLYMQEFLPANRQTLMGTVLQLNNGFIAIYTVVYYWFISNYWIPINVFGGAMTAVSMIGVWFLPESPKFLLTMKRYDETRAAINVITKVNKRPSFNGKFDREVADLQVLGDKGLNASLMDLKKKSSSNEEITQGSPRTSGEVAQDAAAKRLAEENALTGTLKDLVKIRRHLVNLCILVFLWMTASFNLYMIGFYMKYIPGSIFVSTLTASLGDIPLSILGGFLYHWKGPRVAIPVFLICATVGAISLITWVKKVESLIPVVVLLTRSGAKCSFDSCYLANSTIFPAIFAGTAFGICNIGAKMITIFSPLTAEVKDPVPMIIFACLASVAAVAASQLQILKEDKVVKAVVGDQSKQDSKSTK